MNTQIWTLRILIIMFATVVVLLPSGPIAAAPEPPAGATQVREIDGAVMVYVPAGEFLMGSPIMCYWHLYAS